MVKQYPKKTVPKKQGQSSQVDPKLNIVYALILLSYAFITILTPNLNTLDSNGPKFYTLAILNLVSYIIIIIGNQLKPRQNFHGSFFYTWIGLIYALFLMVSLLSFINAINIYESIINFSKLFTIFAAAYIVSIILRQDKRYIYILSISLALLLVIDSFTVFYHIFTSFMQGERPKFSEIKSGYSNKNILSAAIFVKIAFGLWLLTFSKSWLKALGGFTICISFIATLFMSTRSFYIGSIFLIIMYIIFMFIRYFRNKEKQNIIALSVGSFVVFVVIFVLFPLALKFLYSKTSQEGGRVVDFVSRLKSISNYDGETFGYGGRTGSWERSFKLIQENSILGVGTGNWKVEILKSETPTSGAYIYMYKNHNDFIETTAETGIFGGALFLGIFILIIANFIKAFFKAKKGEEESYKWLFLPAFGLFCYFFDAFFNFPSDRPEIISFFAIFVGAGVAFSTPSIFLTNILSRVTRHVSRDVTRVTFIATLLLLMVGSIYIFYLNFESLKLQRIAKEELNAGTLTSSSELFLNEFPAIPDINIEGEPIAVTKARYLITEEKYQQAIDLLKKDNSSPYDTRQEFFIAMAYLKMNQFDSALVYTQKVYKLKPYFSGNVSLMSSAFEAKGDISQALLMLDNHIKMNAKNKQPITDIIKKQRFDIYSKVKINQNLEIFNNGLTSFNQKEYNKAINYFSEFISKETGVAQVFEYRAFCYFYRNNFQLSYNDIEKAIVLDPTKPGYYNMRGVNHQMLGNYPAACADFQKAIEMGDKDAVNNYEKFCKKVTK